MHQSVPSLSKLHQCVHNSTKLHHSSPDFSNLQQSALNFTNLHQVVPNCITAAFYTNFAPNLTSLNHTAPIWTMLYLTSPKCTKLHLCDVQDWKQSQNLLANIFGNFGQKYLKKTAFRNVYLEEIENIPRTRNLTRIARCSKNFPANICRNFCNNMCSKNMINRNCLQKSEEVGKNLKSNKNFNFNKKSLWKISQE